VRTIKNKQEEYLKKAVWELLLNQGKSLNNTISTIACKANIRRERVTNFVKQLYKRGFIIVSSRRYGFTLEGQILLLSLLRNSPSSKERFQGDLS
jgi:DNA-binding MarR family transcriptional regulator